MQLFGYWVYVATAEKPNTGSWAIWTFSAIVDFASYAVMTQDWVKNILPAACALACIVTFVYCLFRGKFTKLDRTEWVFFGLDSSITVTWAFTSATVANLLFQASTVISFIPIIRGLQMGKDREHYLPWLIWTVAYFLFLISVTLRLQDWTELAYPVSHVITHFVVLMIALEQHWRPLRI
jgi:hypothetical protein